MSSRLVRLQQVLRITLLSGALLACKDDCVFYPCPLPVVATITVGAARSVGGIPGLSMAVNGTATDGACSQGSENVCRIVGGRGSYQVEFRAPGYVPAKLDLTITGTDAGCNTCGHVDAQTVVVTMQPQV